MSAADAELLGVWSKPTIVGDLVTLRPYRADDADALWEMVHDAEGNDLTATTAAFTRRQIDDWAASRGTADDRLDLVVEENATGEYTGEVVLNEFDAKTRAAHFRIALRGPTWFGRGLGTEATRLVCSHAFTAIGAESIVLEVLARNPRAVRAYEKAGFTVSRTYSEDGEEWIEMTQFRSDS